MGMLKLHGGPFDNKTINYGDPPPQTLVLMTRPFFYHDYIKIKVKVKGNYFKHQTYEYFHSPTCPCIRLDDGT